MSRTIKLPNFCDHCGKAFIAQKTTTRYCGHKCNSAAYKKAKREEKVNAEFKNQQSKIVSPTPVVATETLSNSIAGKMIDASFAIAPRQRNTREENQERSRQETMER